MPLVLVTGPANSGKAGRILRELRARAAEDPVLVVPTARDVERVLLELARAGAVVGPRVVRFDGLVDRVGRRLGLSCGRIATPVQRELVMQAALRDAGLRVLARSAARPGFRRAALRFVAELERSGVEPPALEEALGRWAGHGARRAYAREVAALYGAYRDRLAAAGLSDREALARRIVDALRAAPGRLEPFPVLVHGFDDFTELELELLEVLAGSAGATVTVSLPFEPGREAFRAVAPVAERLRALAGGHEHLEPSAAHYEPGSRTALHHAERGLFEHEAPRVDPGDAVVLLEAGGERAELELVGARVLALMREGTPPGDIAIVLRDPEASGSLLENVLGAYGIPWAGERSVPFGHTPLGRGLLALLRCAGPEGSADDLLAYLRTPGVLRRSGLADRLEAEVRRAGEAGAAEAAERWEATAWPLDDLRRLRASGSPAERVAALAHALDRLWAGPRRRDARVLAPEELPDAAAYAAARAALDDVAALGLAAAADAASLHQLLAGLAVPADHRGGRDRVQVTSPEGVRARRFAAVFLLGLVEGEFPRRAAAEPFLPDEDRREIAHAAGLRLPMRADEAERERYLLYVCASRAERLLAVCVRTSDEEGQPLVPSPFVDDLRALFTPALDERREARSLDQVIRAEDAAPTELERDRARAAAAAAGCPPRRDGLRHPEVLRALAERPAWSAAALEAFADCPVKWLVERVLDPDPLEPDAEGLVRGSYAHRVLELTYRRLGESTGSARVTPASLPEAERLLVRALEECRPAHRISPKRARARAAVRRLEADLLRHLRREARSGGSFEPRALELSFGMGGAEGSHPPLDLGEVRIRGRIDRVDACGSRAVVRDYKAGGAGHPAGRWRQDGRLQAPLYMLAVREILGLEPAGGLYVPLSGDEKPRGAWLDESQDELGSGLAQADRASREDLEGHLRAARETACELVRRVRAGQVRPTPATCHWRGEGCSYPVICRAER